MGRVSVQKSDPPETTEILAESIVRLGQAIDKLHENGLNHRAVVVLLHDATKVPKGQIEGVLQGMRQLRAWYCR